MISSDQMYSVLTARCSDAAMGDLLLHDGAPGEAEAHAAKSIQLR